MITIKTLKSNPSFNSSDRGFLIGNQLKKKHVANQIWMEIE